jgi:fido (protein-threonine AMPylation protein)
VINAGAEPTQWMDLHSRMSAYGHEMDERIKTLNPGAENIGNFLDNIAWGHYELSIIHPFIDGNGRTSRQSMDLLCKHFGIKSITLGRINKPAYIQALSQVDQTGELDYFTLFLSAQLWREYARSKSPVDQAYAFHIQEKIKTLNQNISNSIKHN